MRVLIIGANSAIAQAIARILTERGDTLYLVARNANKLTDLINGLKVRGAGTIHSSVLDLCDHARHEQLVREVQQTLGEIDTAILCHGSLPNQLNCEGDYDRAETEIKVNGLSVISLLTTLAPVMTAQGHGNLAVITSVAGDRGRRSNYVYGAAKALVSAYLQGLRGRLHADGVHVLEIRPGLVDTPMTAHLPKSRLFSSPERVAKIILNSIGTKRHTVYAPGYWRLIMAIVRAIPDPIFKRLNF